MSETLGTMQAEGQAERKPILRLERIKASEADPQHRKPYALLLHMKLVHLTIGWEPFRQYNPEEERKRQAYVEQMSKDLADLEAGRVSEEHIRRKYFPY